MHLHLGRGHSYMICKNLAVDYHCHLEKKSGYIFTSFARTFSFENTQFSFKKSLLWNHQTGWTRRGTNLHWAKFTRKITQGLNELTFSRNCPKTSKNKISCFRFLGKNIITWNIFGNNICMFAWGGAIPTWFKKSGVDENCHVED